MVRRELPFTQRRAVQRAEGAAVAIAFQHSEHGRRQRRQQFAVHDGARVGAEQLDVQRVVAAPLVERLDHLVHAARLRAARLALFGEAETVAV